ncbi:MAG: hypothetical protein ACOX7U_05615 [Desulfitobacteriia bacterium]|jgi:hypothetical protein
MKERTQFNFAQRWEEEEVSRQRRKGLVTVLVLLIGIILLAPWIIPFAIDKKLTVIDDRIANYSEFDPLIVQVETLKEQITRLENFIQVVEKNTKNPRTIRAEILKVLPPGIDITSLNLNSDYTIQLGVAVIGPVNLANLWKNFNDSELFSGFDIQTVSLTEEEQNLSFTLKMNNEEK